MRRLAEVRKLVGKWRNLESKIAEITEDLILAEEEPSLITEIKPRITESATHLDEMELEIAFSGEYDDRDALLSIHAGAGGTESQDWAEMLLRMYLHWAERRGYQSEILETTPGEETGLKSVTIEVSGDYAFGYLKSEHGVHRLVRLSPFDSDHARHTSFALVEIMPEAEDDMAVQIRTEDLKMDMFRSSGAGGQNVQKTSTAVRLTHLPTGLTVTCQNERSQYQNREIALKILQARLLEAEVARKAEERAKLKGKRVEAGWGNQVRSYVLHPYKMVKDHRTDYQTGNTEAVLSGELDGFITAYLRSLVGKEKG
jgi:peptide chain release factor 2|tara:strand:- start:6902 stop:7843 length:942 start_codon:yes stop_codon:yes gene_type:complete